MAFHIELKQIIPSDSFPSESGDVSTGVVMGDNEADADTGREASAEWRGESVSKKERLMLY